MDEVSIGYNAYSILKTGKDEHGKKLPLYFEAFGEYKLPAYIYSVSTAQFFLGKSNLSVRLPSVLAGIGTVAFLILFIAWLTPNRKLALLSGFILSVSPWQIHFSRAGFEANMALFFITCGIFYLYLGLKKNLFWVISLILFILAYFTYFGARIFIPLFLIFFLISERRIVFKFFYSRVYLIVILVLLALILVPFAFSSQAMTRALSVSFIRDVKPNPDTLFENRILLSIEQFFKNYLKNFSFEYLFFKGDGNGRHGVREIGQLYYWQLPLLIYGLFKAFRKLAFLPHRQAGARDPSTSLGMTSKIFLAWLLIAPIPAALATPNPHALRSYLMVIPLTYFTALGLYRFNSKRDCFSRCNIGIAMTLVVCYFLFTYLHIYFVHYPKRTSPDWSGGYKQTIEYINSNENKYDTILITDKMSQGYVYLYYYGDFDPSTVYKTSDYQQGSGKYRFVSSPQRDKFSRKVLYISPYWETRQLKKLREIKNKGGDIVFNIWEN